MPPQVTATLPPPVTPDPGQSRRRPAGLLLPGGRELLLRRPPQPRRRQHRSTGRHDQQPLACDVHRIEAADPYPDGYDATVARNVREQDGDARPAIAGPLPSIDDYDTVLLASPIWNVRAPMIMTTFTESSTSPARPSTPSPPTP